MPTSASAFRWRRAAGAPADQLPWCGLTLPPAIEGCAASTVSSNPEGRGLGTRNSRLSSRQFHRFVLKVAEQVGLIPEVVPDLTDASRTVPDIGGLTGCQNVE